LTTIGQRLDAHARLAFGRRPHERTPLRRRVAVTQPLAVDLNRVLAYVKRGLRTNLERRLLDFTRGRLAGRVLRTDPQAVIDHQFGRQVDADVGPAPWRQCVAATYHQRAQVVGTELGDGAGRTEYL